MELKENYTVNEVVEIVNKLSPNEKVLVRDILNNNISNKEIAEIMNIFHLKYEDVYKSLA
ncbi:MAG: hypothetical protein SFY32_16305 [Bacteroidota bacterium]|nr:hypothetical protein [Bacteroidota bacterium]